jgi:hypothetical protein
MSKKGLTCQKVQAKVALPEIQHPSQPLTSQSGQYFTGLVLAQKQ